MQQFLSWPVVYNYGTEHGFDSYKLCEKYRNDLA